MILVLLVQGQPERHYKWIMPSFLSMAGNPTKCVVCLLPLNGRQTKFCSRKCKNADTNNRHQSYLCQQARGLRRKRELVAERGGRCEICGYDRNLAALVWHHIDPASKSFELDLRAMSNRGVTALRAEFQKCQLLCANCHAEIHHPDHRLHR